MFLITVEVLLGNAVVHGILAPFLSFFPLLCVGILLCSDLLVEPGAFGLRPVQSVLDGAHDPGALSLSNLRVVTHKVTRLLIGAAQEVLVAPIPLQDHHPLRRGQELELSQLDDKLLRRVPATGAWREQQAQEAFPTRRGNRITAWWLATPRSGQACPPVFDDRPHQP